MCFLVPFGAFWGFLVLFGAFLLVKSYRKKSLKNGLITSLYILLKWKRKGQKSFAKLQENTCARVLKSQACNFIKKEALAEVFSCEFCEIFKNIFSCRTPPDKWFWLKFFKKYLFEFSCNCFKNCFLNKKTLCVLTIAMICSNLTSFWKFQYFRRSTYNPVEHLWWSFYCKNSEPLSIFTKKLHHRCLLGF